MKILQDGYVHYLWDDIEEQPKEYRPDKDVDRRKSNLSRQIGGSPGHTRTGIYSLKV